MNIYEAITYIMKKGYAVGKDRKNEQQRFFYRGIDDVMNVFQPLMAEAGIFLVPEVLEAKREDRQTAKGGNLIYSVLKMKYTFYASDGSSVSAVVIGEGMDSGDKASNKAMAVAMKYAMFQVFCIPTAELDDPDSESPPPSVTAVTAPPRGGAGNKEELQFPPPSVTAVTAPPRGGAGNIVKCDNCGNPLKGVRRKDGTIVTISELVQYSKDNYQGRTLCRQCMAEEKEQENKNAQ